jgi:ligand-binding sensor domain-containing protein
MLTSLLLASCALDPPAQAPATTVITPTAAPIPLDVVLRPQPTLSGNSAPAQPPTTFTGTITIPSTESIATSTAPGWTGYDSINRIHDLAFAPDGTLWASTDAGLVHWDLRTAAYTRYLIPTFVNDFAVAPDGTLWLSTQQGVCHLSGLAGEGAAVCRFYTEADGLIHNAVRAVDVAPDGTVWVGTETGVSHYTDAGSGTGDGGYWHSYPAPVPTQDLAVAPNGEVWMATASGVGRYQPSQDAWVTYTEVHGLPAAHANVVAIGPEGEVWIYILWQGVYRFTGERWEQVGEIPGGLVGDMAFGSDGTPWVRTVGSQHYPGGALLFREATAWTDLTAAHGLMAISALAVEPGDRVAVGTNRGLGVYQGGEWRLLRDGPMSDRVTTVAVTPDGTVWFGFGDHSVSTLGGGLSRFDGQTWDYVLDDAEVNALTVAPDGALWAGVGCDVRRFDGSVWETVGRCKEDLPLGNVLDIGFAPDGTAWVANPFGLARFDGEWTVFERLANSLMVAPDGAIWINGWEGLQDSSYVARYDGESWNTYRTADAFPGPVWVGAATDDGCIWGSVPDRGLACFSYSVGSTSDGRSWADSESWTFYPVPDALSWEGGTALAVAPDGALWLLAAGGVARLDTSTDQGWTVFATQERLAGSSRAIAFGLDGEIWFGANRLQPAETPE